MTDSTTSERLHALWTLVTAPFPLFLIVLVVSAVCIVNHIEKKETHRG